jgi:hypothetical protein
MKNIIEGDDNRKDLNKIVQNVAMDDREGFKQKKENNHSGKLYLDDNNNTLYGFVLVVTMILILLFFTSCSKNVDFLQSSVVPAAQGYINVTTDNNKNYVIKVYISDLADVGRLQPTMKSYVVWAETDQGNIENIGQLSSSTSFISSQMRATLKTVSSFKPRKIFITAENAINAQMPGNFVVLSTEEFK